MGEVGRGPEAGALMAEDLIADAVGPASDTVDGGVSEVGVEVFGAIWLDAAVVEVGHDVVDEGGDGAISGAAGIGDGLGAAHKGMDVGKDARGARAMTQELGAAELILVVGGESLADEFIGGGAPVCFIDVSADIEPLNADGDEGKIDPFEDTVQGEDGVFFAGEGATFFEVHCSDGDVLLEEVDEEVAFFFDQRGGGEVEYNGDVGGGGHLQEAESGAVDRPVGVAKEEGCSDKERGLTHDLFGDIVGVIVIDDAVAHAEAAFAIGCDKGDGFGDGTGFGGEVLQIDVASCVGEVAEGIVTRVDGVTDGAQEDRPFIAEEGVVMEGVAYGAARRDVVDESAREEVVVEVFDDAVLKEGAAATGDGKAFEFFGGTEDLHIDDQLVKAQDVESLFLFTVGTFGDPLFGNGEEVFSFAVAGESHG